MSNIINSLYNMRHLDELSRKNTVIHRIHPLMKLLTTLVYLLVVVSFGKYEIGRLLPFLFFPVLIFTLAEVPLAPILKRVLLIEPLIIGIGILNPLFDPQVFVLGGVEFSMGWVTFLAIFLKCGLTVTAALLLIATTGIDKMGLALRMLKIPRLFVLQMLLTYRYISVLSEEVASILRAYSLRAPGQKGIQRNVWGSLIGQLILRTYDRGQRVYTAMCLRGFKGEYHTGSQVGLKLGDCLYLTGWVLFFIMARLYDLPVLIGSLVMGVVK